MEEIKSNLITAGRGTKYIKGVSGNPKGRPAGKYSAATVKFMKMKVIAADNADKAFKLLWGAMVEGHSWAFQIYFKDLYSVPKNFGELTIKLDNTDRTIDGQLKVLSESLPDFEDVTYSEHMERFKMLHHFKSSGLIEKQLEEVKESKASLQEKVALIQKIVDFHEGV